MMGRMAAPKFLAPGEHVVFHVRAHWKGLITPVLALLAIGALTWFALVWWVPNPETQAEARRIIAGVAVVLVCIFTGWPYLRWLTTTDTLTTKRLISREGIITRTGRDIPIDRVNAVNYERTLIDRVFGCGTLIVQTAGTESDVELHDIAHIERRLIQIQQILVDEQNEEDRRVRAIVAEEQRHAREGSSTTAARRTEASTSPSEPVGLEPEADAAARDDATRGEPASDARSDRSAASRAIDDAAPTGDDREAPGGEPTPPAR